MCIFKINGLSKALSISEPHSELTLNHFCFLTGKVPPVVIAVTVGLSNLETEVTPAPNQESRFSIWLTVGVLFGILLLMAVIPIAACALRCNYTKLR